jgi:hypothetical protein
MVIVWNSLMALPTFTSVTLVYRESLDWGPSVSDKKKMKAILDQVAALIKGDLIGQVTLRTFFI